jgi:uncharacterized membrane protein YhfC
MPGYGCWVHWAWLVLPVVIGTAGCKPKAAPAELLYGRYLPDWQVFRAQNSDADSRAAREMIRGAKAWPAVAEDLRRIDENWPDDKRVAESVAALNQHAQLAGLSFWVDAQVVQGRPILLTYKIQKRAVWKLASAPDAQANPAPTSVEVLQLARLDSLNIEMGLIGQLNAERPLVFMDRVEGSVQDEISRAFGKGKPLDEVEAAALEQLRRIMEKRVGADRLQALGVKTAARDRVFQAMLDRLKTSLKQPDRFVWGDAWFETVRPLTKFDRPGGPVVFASDLREVQEADRALDKPELREVVAQLVALNAEAVEAHEARHAFEKAPMPAPLLLRDLFRGETQILEMAEAELRAYLGEMHDSPAPPCLTLLQLLRQSFGAAARPTPHFFAGYALLGMLATPAKEKPVDLIYRLCALPESEVRSQAAQAWKKFYGVNFRPAVRSPGSL